MLKTKLITINKQGLAINTQCGFIALTSVIILGAVVVLLIIGIFTGAAGEMERGGEKEKGEKTLSWANLCMEVALNELRNDYDGYGGGQEITITGVDGSCDILTLDRTGGIITITTEGEIPGHIRKMEVEVQESSGFLSIINWREIE